MDWPLGGGEGEGVRVGNRLFQLVVYSNLVPRVSPLARDGKRRDPGEEVAYMGRSTLRERSNIMCSDSKIC